jgi:DNA-binding beta-propeller fold protein YncE
LGDEVYVIDTTGRVQVFNSGGGYLRHWTLPETENGTPTDVAFDNADKVLIPDTHSSRILEYEQDGTLIRQWGSYGKGENEFIYPTGIEQAPDGSHFISEYGLENERVHVFGADRAYLRQWNGSGGEAGRFGRPMAIALDDNLRVFVCDTANHRIQVFDPDGSLAHIFGSAGTGFGNLKFPYDIAMTGEGDLLVCEYGNHRVSRWSLDGIPIAVAGRPGPLSGEFNGPRGVAVSSIGFVFVADTDNDRIQRFPLAAIS